MNKNVKHIYAFCLIQTILLMSGCGALISLSGCGKQGDTQYTNLYVYGDSITYGLTHPTYPETLAPMMNWKLIQNSHGGTSLYDKNSSGDSEQYPILMNATWESSAVILWSPGFNDAFLHGTDADYMKKYKQGFTDVLNHIHSQHVHAFIGTPNHNGDENRFGPNSIIDQYAQINRDIIAQLNDSNIQLIDFNKNFTPTFDQSLDYYSRFNSSTGTTLDGAHPNNYGYKQMTQIFLSQMK